MGLEACGVSKISFQSPWPALEQVPTTCLSLIVLAAVTLFLSLLFISSPMWTSIVFYARSRIYRNKLLSTETAQRARQGHRSSLGCVLGSEPATTYLRPSNLSLSSVSCVPWGSACLLSSIELLAGFSCKT